ncbi:M23 family metallopeptidase [Anaerosalibacter massiliensis]|uniref:M23 family metallopeptidase n=1 Tax=Anaerosalibacter massiliensis TaxID=1347392 RepID=A0A9X2MKH0_9FIRM|nr:M23 family metallopeptidase [Anaerosalibacter massiliensis]MCR2044710.1 M23 family metallopeptidase [Anaerosalibacter massiliensis]
MKKKFDKLTHKDSFYIILFVCVCIVGTAAVWASKKNLDRMKSENDPVEEEDFLILTDEDKHGVEEPSLESLKQQEKKRHEEKQKQEEEKEEPKEETKEEPKEEPKEKPKEEQENNVIQTFYMPVEGEIGLDFSTDNLAYSKTLEEWTSHEGIDIKANEGTAVKACLDGVVKEVYEDELWGIVITIDHGKGLESRYANLSTKDMVKKGQSVKKGTPISGVGKPKGLEMADEPHLHFETIFNGKKVDPKKYLPGIN